MTTEVPTFVICRDRLTPLTALVRWLEKAGRDRVLLIDSASSYPPLLDYYQSCPYPVHRCTDNVGNRSPWALGLVPPDEPYVVTDCDVLPDQGCPEDVYDHLGELVGRFGEEPKVGLGLRLDDLPVQYSARRVVQKNEARFWEKEIAPGIFGAEVDTTFALYPPGRPFVIGGLRTGPPYLARHLTWYIDDNDFAEDEAYYRSHISRDYAAYSLLPHFDAAEAPNLYMDFEKTPEFIDDWPQLSRGIVLDDLLDVTAIVATRTGDPPVPAEQLAAAAGGLRGEVLTIEVPVGPEGHPQYTMGWDGAARTARSHYIALVPAGAVLAPGSIFAAVAVLHRGAQGVEPGRLGALRSESTVRSSPDQAGGNAGGADGLPQLMLFRRTAFNGAGGFRLDRPDRASVDDLFTRLVSAGWATANYAS
jgi:hypothetical protein